MMVPTLRSLCLFTVSKLQPCFKDVPTELITDMLKMKAFNGSYSLDSKEKSGVSQQTVLSIFYNGASWTFKSVCRCFPFFCCFDCDAASPEMITVTMTEGEQVLVKSTFGEIMRCYDNGDKTYHPTMKMSVEFGESGGFGIISFTGSDKGTVKFKSTLHVDLAW